MLINNGKPDMIFKFVDRFFAVNVKVYLFEALTQRKRDFRSPLIRGSNGLVSNFPAESDSKVDTVKCGVEPFGVIGTLSEIIYQDFKEAVSPDVYPHFSKLTLCVNTLTC